MSNSLKTTVFLMLASFIMFACGDVEKQKSTSEGDLVFPASGKAIRHKNDTKSDAILTEPVTETILVDDDHQQFIGLNIHKLHQLLGSPILVRRDNNAEVWQYKGRLCTLDVFLYKKDLSLQVKYVDLRGEMGRESNQACMVEILR